MSDASYFHNVNLSRFPTIVLDFSPEVHVSLPPASYLEVNNGGFICRSVVAYPESFGGSAVLGVGFLRRYFVLFDRQKKVCGLSLFSPRSHHSDRDPGPLCT
eukprot:COSAG01_NODE_4406_length_5056_cov_124.577365_7_plen_102_part_00